MAKKRSNRRRLSLRPESSPDSLVRSERTIPDSSNPETLADVDTTIETKNENDRETDSDEPRVSLTEKQPASQPSEQQDDEPTEPKQQDEGEKPTGKQEPDAPEKPAKEPPTHRKNKGEHKSQKRKRKTDSPKDTTQDERLHDDFFLAGEEVERQHLAQTSAPPLEDTEESTTAPEATSKELLERRKKMRKIVAAILIPAVFIAVAGGIKLMNGGDTATASSYQPSTPMPSLSALNNNDPSPHPSTQANAQPSVEDDSGIQPAVDEQGDVMDGSAASLGQEDAQQEDAQQETEERHKEDAATQTPPSEPPLVDIPDGVDPRKEALKALEQGKWEQAISMSQAALTKDPENATLYLYYGTALQQLGRRSEATKIFQDCVANAKKGPIHECRMFAK